MQPLVDQSEIDVSDIFDYVAESVVRWKDLARKLELSEAKIGRTDAEQRGNVKESCIEILETWRLKEGCNATVEALQGALTEAGQKAIADEIDDHLRNHLEGKSPTVFRKRKRTTFDVEQLETLTITEGSHTTVPAGDTDSAMGSTGTGDSPAQPRLRTKSGDTLGMSPRAHLAECTKCHVMSEDLQSYLKCSTGHLICHISQYVKASEHTTKDSVWIFVVDSNLWVEGKKLISKERKFKVAEDPRIRIDVGKNNQLLTQAIVFEGVQKQPDSWKMGDKWVKRMEEVCRWPFRYAWILEDNVDINDLLVVFIKGKDTEGTFRGPELDEMLDLVKKDPCLLSVSTNVQAYFSYSKKSRETDEGVNICLSNQFSGLTDMYDKVEQLEDEGFHSLEEEREDETTLQASFAIHQRGARPHLQQFPVQPTYRQPSRPGARQHRPFYHPPVTSQAMTPWSPTTEASGAWIPAPMKNRQSPYRPRYSEHCPRKFNCGRGRHCEYTHTPEEVEFLKQRPPGLKVYKVKLCDKWKTGYCMSEACACNWAHGEGDASCLRCNCRGHLTDNCPTYM
uniref:Death domain-containing protein n=1 Tax=Branchiostoma floridae TaxID=7739 RepID=C3Y2Q7_BRAFL|eukprot:XP_002609309.1 hypothetical protein BRAFLDRAFT_86773 [Branchiostoma floridae]